MVIQSRPLQLLLTRPKAQGLRFAKQLRAGLSQPFDITYAPLIQPVFLHPQLSKTKYHAVVLTSETGALAAASYDGLPKLAYCVGDQTARAARRAGFVTQSAAGDAEALIRMILQTFPNQPLLHICGIDTRGDVAEKLNKARIKTDTLTAYRQDPAPLTKEARRLLAGTTPVIVPLFSPRSAQIFVAEAEPGLTAPLCIVAMSVAVAQALGTLPIARLETATEPNAKAMIAAVGQIADKFPVA
jgi:uroporphyrinogen-III synthase